LFAVVLLAIHFTPLNSMAFSCIEQGMSSTLKRFLLISLASSFLVFIGRSEAKAALSVLACRYRVGRAATFLSDLRMAKPLSSPDLPARDFVTLRNSADNAGPSRYEFNRRNLKFLEEQLPVNLELLSARFTRQIRDLRQMGKSYEPYLRYADKKEHLFGELKASALDRLKRHYVTPVWSNAFYFALLRLVSPRGAEQIQEAEHVLPFLNNIESNNLTDTILKIAVRGQTDKINPKNEKTTLIPMYGLASIPQMNRLLVRRLYPQIVTEKDVPEELTEDKE
jgi:hypothetical protein